MPVVTLTSDWSNFDYYVGSLKGKILSLLPEANIIDLNHNIQPFRIAQAAFIIRNTYYHFPKGTIHLVCLNSEPAKDKNHLVIKYDGHYIICADNGIIGLICNDEDKITSVYKYSGKPGPDSFKIMQVYPEIVKAIADEKIEKIANEVSNYDKHVPMRPVFDEGVITGSVIYIDSYRNALTNIKRKLFNDVGKGRKFEILVQSNHYRITKLNITYHETTVGELLALFNSLDLLEIAIKDGNAADLLNLAINAVIRIKFFD